MKVTVIGGGNGAFAAVADFTEAGHEVRWWRRGGNAGLTAITLIDHAGSRTIGATATADIAIFRGSSLALAFLLFLVFLFRCTGSRL